MSGRRGPRRPATLSRALSEQGREAPAVEAGMRLEGVLDGLKGLVEGIQDLAQAAQKAGAARDGRVVFGYSVRTLDGSAQPFGHVPQARPARAADGAEDTPVVPEARQPIVDVFEEAEAITVVAEVPGLDPDRLTLSVEEGALLIAGEGAQRYRHRVALPGPVRAEGMAQACRNGILEVRLPRAAGPAR